MMRLTALKIFALLCVFCVATACEDTSGHELSEHDTGNITSDAGSKDVEGSAGDTEGSDTESLDADDKDVESDIEGPDEEDPLPNVEDTIILGEGSGHLTIDGYEGEQLSIKPGTYSGVTIKNIKNTSIDGFDNVTVKGGLMDITNIDGLTVRGIDFRDHGQTVIWIYEPANNLTLKGLSFKDISNWVIRFKNEKKYDGSPESYSENIHLLDLKAENVGALFNTSGDIREDGLYGVIKGLKLSRCQVTNSPHFSGMWLAVAEDYEVSNNVFDNVNASEAYPDGNNNHNGLIHVLGNGKIFNNKATNHQGNLVRAWLFSTTEPDAEVEIYDNIVYNSTRYSAFELQVTPSMEVMSSFVPAHAKVYNNTVGKMNTGEPKYYEGRVLDLYGTHGKLEIYDNLYFDMRDEELMLNMSGSTEITRNTGNRYFPDAGDAVVDLVDFKSKIPGVGAR